MRPKKANAPASVLRIVQNQPSKDEELIDTLIYLLSEATAGRLTGIAYVATLPQKKYIMDTIGETARNAIGALGMVHMLADELTRLLRPADE